MEKKCEYVQQRGASRQTEQDVRGGRLERRRKVDSHADDNDDRNVANNNKEIRWSLDS